MTAQLTLSPCWSRLITGAQELLNVFPFQWCCCLTLQGELQTELITRFVRLHSLLTRRNISKAPFSPLWAAGLFFPSWETCHSLYLIESKMLLLYTPPCLSLWAALENSQARSPVQFRNMLDVVFSNMGLPLAVEAQHTFLCYSRLWAAINPLAIFSWKKKKNQNCFTIAATASTAPILGKLKLECLFCHQLWSQSMLKTIFTSAHFFFITITNLRMKLLQTVG